MRNAIIIVSLSLATYVVYTNASTTPTAINSNNLPKDHCVFGSCLGSITCFFIQHCMCSWFYCMPTSSRQPVAEQFRTFIKEYSGLSSRSLLTNTKNQEQTKERWRKTFHEDDETQIRSFDDARKVYKRLYTEGGQH